LLERLQKHRIEVEEILSFINITVLSRNNNHTIKAINQVMMIEIYSGHPYPNNVTTH
jgi:hypothetical protein